MFTDSWLWFIIYLALAFCAHGNPQLAIIISFVQCIAPFLRIGIQENGLLLFCFRFNNCLAICEIFACHTAE